MPQIVQSSLVDIIILVAIATAAHKGWSKGFLNVCAPIIAAVFSVILIRQNAFGFLNGIISLLMSLLAGIITSITKVPVNTADSNIIIESIEKSAGSAQLNSSLQFIITFSLLTMVVRLTVKSLGAHQLPFVGEADSILGAGTCVVARLLIIWTIMTIMVALAGMNEGMAQILSNMDKGLFHVIYANNPIQKYLMIKYTQFIG